MPLKRRSRLPNQRYMTNTVQVICARTGKSHSVEPEYLPDADEYRATCPGCMCGSAEYREPEGIEA